ncbi:YgaP family membrane protein [Halobacterium wangiae]|uniref:YgaP family membrane protein n=1 Tax=Halobacterium wangiae TaxID=2902623 RepID=UPI001E5D9B32|nr:DUF2892 domain-containing protein [Halobacterium wangiae]
MGGVDRLLRLIVGPALLVVAAAELLGAIVLGPIAFAASVVVGAILTITGLTQKCPMNQLIGLNTFRREKTETETEPVDVEPESPGRIA